MPYEYLEMNKLDYIKDLKWNIRSKALIFSSPSVADLLTKQAIDKLHSSPLDCVSEESLSARTQYGLLEGLRKIGIWFLSHFVYN